MPILKKFCNRYELEAGTFIIGWLGLILSIVGFASAVITYIWLRNSLFEDLLFKNLLIIQITSSLLGVITHECLIYGILKKSHLLLLPWLIINALPSFGLPLLVLIGGIIMFCISIWKYAFYLYLFGFPISGGCIYVWICIHSTYTKLKEDTRRLIY